MSKFDYIMTIVIGVLVVLLILELLKRLVGKYTKSAYLVFYVFKPKKCKDLNKWTFGCSEIYINQRGLDIEKNKGTIVDMERNIAKKNDIRFVHITGIIKK